MNRPKPVRGSEFWSYEPTVGAVQCICESAGLPIPTSLQRVKRGEVNAICELGGTGKPMILKVWIRKPDAKEMLWENDVVQNVRERTTVPTPEWLYSNPGDTNVPYPHVIMEHVDAQDADVVWETMTLDTRQELIADCAHSLRELHSLSLQIPSDLDSDSPSDGPEWGAIDSATFDAAVREIRSQGWMELDLLDRCEEAYKRLADVMQDASDFSLVHYDFSLRNIRVDQNTGRLKAVLDFGNATSAPSATDVRDLILGVFVHHRDLGDHFWSAYEVSDERQRVIAQLHSLTRVLDIMAIYSGPTPAGSDAETLEKLLGQIRNAA